MRSRARARDRWKGDPSVARARVELLHVARRLALLLDDLVLAFRADDDLDLGRLMTRRDDEAVRLGAHPLVDVGWDGDLEVAVRVRALAEVRVAVTSASAEGCVLPPREVLYALVDLAIEGLVLSQSFLSGVHPGPVPAPPTTKPAKGEPSGKVARDGCGLSAPEGSLGFAAAVVRFRAARA